MKNITLTIITAFLLIASIACKKNKGQKCYWSGTTNRNTYYSWLVKPSSDQIKKFQDSCSCIVTVDEICTSCDVQLTDAGGNDIPCR